MKFSVKALSFLMMYLVSSMFLVVKDGTVTLGYAELIADDTIEIIEVSGKRTPRPNYNLFIVDMRTFAQMAGWGSTEAEDIYYEEMAKQCEKNERKRPENCNWRNPPSISPDGCSVPTLLRPVYSESIAFFENACQSHDICYVDRRSNKSTCDSSFLNDMLDLCLDGNRNNAFGLSRCRNRATEFYASMFTWISADKYLEAQQKAACVAWSEAYKETC